MRVCMDLKMKEFHFLILFSNNICLFGFCFVSFVVCFLFFIFFFFSNPESLSFKSQEVCYSFGTKYRKLFIWDYLIFPLVNEESRCSSVVRAFAHGAMGRRIDPSWGGPIELFLVPASVPRLV